MALVGAARFVPSGTSPARMKSVSIAAASSLRFVVDDLVADLHGRYASLDAGVTYGSSGHLHAQIAAGAPFDLFLSAESELPQRLDGEPFTYALGRLALWVHRDVPVGSRSWDRVLSDPGIRRVAAASPRHAPYGRAAVEALRSSGVHESVRAKLVFGDNAGHAAHLAASGAAQAAFVPAALVSAPALRERGRHLLVPASAHRPIRHAGVLLWRAVGRDAAGAVRDFLLAPTGRVLLLRHGLEAWTGRRSG